MCSGKHGIVGEVLSIHLWRQALEWSPDILENFLWKVLAFVSLTHYNIFNLNKRGPKIDLIILGGGGSQL